jgi:hypothetical protein
LGNIGRLASGTYLPNVDGVTKRKFEEELLNDFRKSLFAEIPSEVQHNAEELVVMFQGVYIPTSPCK